MIRVSFNEKWNLGDFQMLQTEFWGKGETREVTLPCDAMIYDRRSPDSVKNFNSGFFPGGSCSYAKKFYIPKEYENKAVYIEFEGVGPNAMVRINDTFAGKCPDLYTGFYIHADKFLEYGDENDIEVSVKSPTELDSRWYSGRGVYRNVNIYVGDLLHIAMDGMRIDTPDVERDLAVVNVAVKLENLSRRMRSVDVLTEIIDENGGIIATDRSFATLPSGDESSVCQRIYVHNPLLWSVDTPNLYSCRVRLLENEEIVDEGLETFGIRKLQLDINHGLRINGQEIKLRGASIHHDNGLVGANAFERAEERKIEILKKAGFNAIRSAHNPASRQLLDACDRLGMLVMEEGADVWSEAKLTFDHSLFFDEWWEFEFERMVAKDYNHPCVIMYSIGNEIPETGTPSGAAFSRRLAEKIRNLDSTRYVTNSINAMLSVMEDVSRIVTDARGEAASQDGVPNTEINTFMTDMIELMDKMSVNPIVGEKTQESYAAVDVCGYNYMAGRYECDQELYPNRIMFGSETNPPDIAKNWAYVKKYPRVIGDFTWTGWDYMGEAGIGQFDYSLRGENGVYGMYPWYISGCGDIDITGFRKPVSYWREIVWGLRSEPYIAVQRVDRYGQPYKKSPWVESDVLESWTWPGYEGRPAIVEVYSDAEEVELYLNDRLIGCKKAGEAQNFKALFETIYEPGELRAVARKGKTESTFVLRSASEGLKLKAECDRPRLRCNSGDLAYIDLSLTDADGRIKHGHDRKIRISVEGPACIQGFGSGDPRSEENFFDSERTTFEARAQAVIRATDAGIIHIHFTADGCAPVMVELEAFK